MQTEIVNYGQSKEANKKKDETKMLCDTKFFIDLLLLFHNCYRGSEKAFLVPI